MNSRPDGGIFGDIEHAIKPYRKNFTTFSRLPEQGRDQAGIVSEMETLYRKEIPRWRDGYVSGAVYHGDDDHIDFLNRVYAINSQSNPLHTDIWPSTTKFEAEVVSMTAGMLNGDKVSDTGSGDQVCGVVSSGGTESILLAMKTYRDWAREVKGVTEPEMIVPATAHAAFDKAAQYFNIKMIRIPVDEEFRADVDKTRAAITPNTTVLVGSTPCFPHGTIDPIESLSCLALDAGIGFHTDACLGGFILPWAERLGYPVEPFDFQLPGVTSISIDTHKYGYAAKGSSVILYRNPKLRSYQFYTTVDWPGGLYFSPTFAGSRPGALIATAWAAMLALGEAGYMKIAREILETGSRIKQGIDDISELHVLGDPLWNIAFGSESYDIYKVMGYMAEKGWNLNGLQRPPAVHICLTHRHTQPGLAEKFITDLKESVDQVAEHPEQATSGMGRLYGMASQIPDSTMVDGVLKSYIEMLYRV